MVVTAIAQYKLAVVDCLLIESKRQVKARSSLRFEIAFSIEDECQV